MENGFNKHNNCNPRIKCEPGWFDSIHWSNKINLDSNNFLDYHNHFYMLTFRQAITQSKLIFEYITMGVDAIMIHGLIDDSYAGGILLQGKIV